MLQRQATIRDKKRKRKKFIIEDASESDGLNTDSSMESLLLEDRYLLLGLQSGQIIIYDVQNLKKIYARYEMANCCLRKVVEVACLKLYVALDERNEITVARLDPFQTSIL